MCHLKFVIVLFTILFSNLVFSQTNIQFLPKKQASEFLATADEFVNQLSQFDMAARMKTNQTVDKKQFLEFVSSSALDWNKPDIIKVSQAFDGVYTELQKLNAEMPNDIDFILTDGKEEGNAAYTRGHAIILQRDKLTADNELKRLIAHELFHIFTRSNPVTKDMLYQVIGFHSANELEFPSHLQDRKLTNPDAPINNYVIKINYNDEALWVYPILYASSDQYNPTKGGEFFDYLQFKLLVLGKDKGTEFETADDSPILDVSQVSGFFEQVGKNTAYIIHPEEILADNFAMMVLGSTTIPSPEIIDKIKNVLAKDSEF